MSQKTLSTSPVYYHDGAIPEGEGFGDPWSTNNIIDSNSSYSGRVIVIGDNSTYDQLYLLTALPNYISRESLINSISITATYGASGAFSSSIATTYISISVEGPYSGVPYNDLLTNNKELTATTGILYNPYTSSSGTSIVSDYAIGKDIKNWTQTTTFSGVSVQPHYATGVRIKVKDDDWTNTLGANIFINNVSFAIGYDAKARIVFKDVDETRLHNKVYDMDSAIDDYDYKNLSKTGYTFLGWQASSLVNNSFYNKGENLPACNNYDITYTANWSLIPYTISYNLNGGSLPSGTSNPTAYNVETNEITLVEPTRIGYTFKGWSGTGLSGDSNKNVKIPKGSTGNRTYTANWTPNTYTIEYTLNSSDPYAVDTISNPTSYTIESNTITLNNPRRKGYTFKGWSGTRLTGDTNKTVTISKGSTGDRIYTANWTENYIEFEYWSNNRTEDNKKFVTWKASPSNSSAGWPDNHYDFTNIHSANYQDYLGYKPKLLTGYSEGGYYNTKPDGSGAYSVHENYNFSSYLDVCDKYGINYYEPATTIPIYCQWEPEILVSYDTIFNYFDWYRNEIKPGNASTIVSQNETGFTIKSNSEATDGYSNTSPKFKLAKENNLVIKDYIIDVDVIGSGWQLFIFFYKDDGSEAYYTDSSYYHTNISKSGGIVTAPPEATQAAIRVDSNAANNQVTFINFRIYPAKYYYMRYTVSEIDRSDCGQWSAPANPTRNNNFYKFKHWSKDPSLEGKNNPVTTSGEFPTEDTVLFSQWDKRAPRIFIQETNKTGGKAAPIAQLSNKPIRKAFIYTTDTHKWREC